MRVTLSIVNEGRKIALVFNCWVYFQIDSGGSQQNNFGGIYIMDLLSALLKLHPIFL